MKRTVKTVFILVASALLLYVLYAIDSGYGNFEHWTQSHRTDYTNTTMVMWAIIVLFAILNPDSE
jgi:hypothetical protein